MKRGRPKKNLKLRAGELAIIDKGMAESKAGKTIKRESCARYVPKLTPLKDLTLEEIKRQKTDVCQFPDWKRKAMVNSNYSNECYIPTADYNKMYPGKLEELYNNRYIKPTKEEVNKYGKTTYKERT